MEANARFRQGEQWLRSWGEGLAGLEEVANASGKDPFFGVERLPKFHPGAKRFSWGNAYWLSEFSRLSYLPLGRERDEALARVGVEETERVDEKGCRAFLLELGARTRGPCRVLCVRGTSNLLQWLLDFDFGEAEWAEMKRPGGDGARVHRGFKVVFDAFWPSLEVLLRRQKEPLIYTGHSLGAALVNFAASRIPPRWMCTTGCPRLGNFAFLQQIRDVRNDRIFFGQDLVTAWPGLPIPRAKSELRHAGRPCHLLPGGGIAFGEDPDAPTKDQFPEVWRRVFQAGEGLAPLEPVLDHAPVRYSRALAEGLGKRWRI